MERQVTAEMEGFRARYEAASASAAFAQLRSEGDPREDARLCGRIVELTEELKAYHARMAALDGHLALLTELKRMLNGHIAIET